jgi:hypothetical protein
MASPPCAVQRSFGVKLDRRKVIVGEFTLVARGKHNFSFASKFQDYRLPGLNARPWKL